MSATFADLPINAKFLFFLGGSLLTKTGPRSYDAPQWGQHGNYVSDTSQRVIPYEPDKEGGNG